jgi:endonuclease/exonuclease/phosphatase family metal-dependent hydrolase
MRSGDDTRVRRAGEVAMWALTALVLAEASRALFPILFDTREDTGAAVAVAIANLVFGRGPLVGSVLRAAAGAERATLVAVVALVAGRMAMQFVRPIPIWLVALTAALALAAFALQLASARTSGRAPAFALALLTGFAFDTVIRASFSTWDIVWQAGRAPAFVAASVSIGLLAATLVASAEGHRSSQTERPAFSAILLGPFLLLEVLYLQNVAFVTSEAGVGLPAGIAIVLAGNALGIAACVGAAAASPARRFGVPAAVVAIAGTAGLALVGGAWVLVAAPPTQAAAAALLLLAVASRTRTPSDPVPAWRSDLAASIGMLVFVAAAFAYLIDIDVPLPVPRSAWPIAAAAVLALGATASIGTARLPWALALIPAAGAVVIPAALLATAPTLRPAPHDSAAVRLLDWNIHAAVDGDGQVDLEAIAEVIERADPDVVVLQEVGRGWPITGQADQTEWLSRRLAMHVAWASAADDQFGNAVLTRAPASDVRVVPLPYGEGPQQRSAVALEIATGDGDPLLVVGTHLQNGDVPRTRSRQIAAVLDLIRPGQPAVIAGDLNMQPTEGNVASFEHAGFVSVQDEAGDPGESTARDPAFPGDRVDWIWHTPDLTASTFTIVQTREADHLPLVVTLTS